VCDASHLAKGPSPSNVPSDSFKLESCVEIERKGNVGRCRRGFGKRGRNEEKRIEIAPWKVSNLSFKKYFGCISVFVSIMLECESDYSDVLYSDRGSKFAHGNCMRAAFNTPISLASNWRSIHILYSCFREFS
jgi:hypothetical protein